MIFLKSVIISITFLFLASCLKSEVKITSLKKLVQKTADFGIQIDRTFGTNGKIDFTYSDLEAQIHANFIPIKRQELSDESLIIYGKSSITGASGNNVGFIYKFNDQMKLDTNFGNNGLLDIVNNVSSVNFIRLAFEDNTKLLGVDSSDRIYLGGKGQVIRFLKNGDFDYSFGKKGISEVKQMDYEKTPIEIISFDDETYTMYVEKKAFDSLEKEFELVRFNYNGQVVKYSEDYDTLKLSIESIYNSSGITVFKFFPAANNQYYVIGQNNKVFYYFLIKSDGTIDSSFLHGYGLTSSANSLVLKDVYEYGDFYYLILKSTSTSASSDQSEIVKLSKLTNTFTKITPPALVATYTFSIESSDMKGNVIYYSIKSRRNAVANERREFIMKHELVGDVFTNFQVRDLISTFTTHNNYIALKDDSLFTITFTNSKTQANGFLQSFGEITKHDSTSYAVDTQYENNGKFDFSLDYKAKIDLVDASLKILLDNKFYSYYLLSYKPDSLSRVDKILKFNKEMVKDTSFGGGEISLSSDSLTNYLGMEFSGDELILFYEKIVSGNIKLFIKKMNKDSGIIDTSIGNAGEVEIYSIPTTETSFKTVRNTDLQLIEYEPLYKGFSTKKDQDKILIHSGMGESLIFSSMFLLEFDPHNLTVQVIKNIDKADYKLKDNSSAVGFQAVDMVSIYTSMFNISLNARKIFSNPFKKDYIDAIAIGATGSAENIKYKKDGLAQDKIDALSLIHSSESSSSGGININSAKNNYILNANKDLSLVSEVSMYTFRDTANPTTNKFHYTNALKVYDRDFNLKYDLLDYSHLSSNLFHDQDLFLNFMISSYFNNNKFEYAEAVMEGSRAPSAIGLSEYLLTLMKINRVQITLEQDGSVKDVKNHYLDYFDYLDLYAEEYFLGRSQYDFIIEGKKYKLAKTLDSTKRSLRYALYKIND